MIVVRCLEEDGMRFTYDPTVDALAIDLAPDAKSRRTQALNDDVNLDWDADGRLITIEILAASTYYPRAVLEQLGSGETWLTLPQAAKESGLGAATLRGLLNQERLHGERRGRDWYITRTAILNYLANRKPVGRPAKQGSTVAAMRRRPTAKKRA